MSQEKGWVTFVPLGLDVGLGVSDSKIRYEGAAGSVSNRRRGGLDMQIAEAQQCGEASASGRRK